ncbi:MAG: triose-phosphate isomerase [Acidimicrobiia bacterium]|nr:triose-phosphate isomerase [Acidimicrobiia bacterium]NNL28464.1 triose-phosphate isomerase [Acidimicrobiia bacterium]
MVDIDERSREQRKNLIIGNWKMHHTHLDAIQVIQKLSYRLDLADYERVDVGVAPPFTALRSAQTVIEADRLPILLGAQDAHFAESGAFTGEISAPMLAKLSVRFVIVGHSERREHFGEDDVLVNKKAKAVLAAGMTPVVCVGETLEIRERDETNTWVAGQVKGAIKGIEDVRQLVFAYEPIWAIGTGRTPSTADAADVIDVIRETLGQAAPDVRMLYGGSVNAGNIADFMAKTTIDGALVGGASLDPDSFASIVRYWI